MEENAIRMPSPDRGENSFPPVSSIAMSRTDWLYKQLQIFDEFGSRVGTGLCCNTNPVDCIDLVSELGEHDVGIVLLDVVSESNISADSIRTLRRWPLSQCFLDGHRLSDRLACHNLAEVEKDLQRIRQGQEKKRTYNFITRKVKVYEPGKKDDLLLLDTVKRLTLIDCCNQDCLVEFPRKSVLQIRKHYLNLDFKGRKRVALNLHRSIHRPAGWNSDAVTLDGRVVCLVACREIHGISRATYHRDAILAKDGIRDVEHGNVGLKKPRASTIQGCATLQILIERQADIMPHRSRTLDTGERVVEQVLPSGVTWVDLLEEVNVVNDKLGFPPISRASFSQLRLAKFKQCVTKRSGDGFARCAKCDSFKAMLNQHSRGSTAHTAISLARKRHLILQESARQSYASDRSLSIKFPDTELCIIHDKMDYGKTALPVLAYKNKATDKFERFPISVAGAIAHGHGDMFFAHYTLDVYPSDANHTNGSIMHLLKQLEEKPSVISRRLFPNLEQSTGLYKALLNGVENMAASLPPYDESEIQVSNRLPPVLRVQMDNCGKDNKSIYNMLFWSLLVAKRVFREVIVSFLVVGHTHEDIDGLFGRWSQDLKRNDCMTLPDLMKSFMTLSKKFAVIPHLIEELPDFKAWIEGCYRLSSSEKLIGHSKAHQFRFFVDSKSWPVMQYKDHSTDKEWLPDVGIRLWKEYPISGKPMLPQGEPNVLVPAPMKDHDDVVLGIKSWINHWKAVSSKDTSGGYGIRINPVIDYWSNVVSVLSEVAPTIPTGQKLRTSYWPKTVCDELEDIFAVDGSVLEENERDTYCGPAEGRPPESFRPGYHIKKGFFCLVRANGEKEPVWLVRALDDPNKCTTGMNARSVQIEWFVPKPKPKPKQQKKARGRPVVATDPYSGWDSSNFVWVADPEYEGNLNQWVILDAVLACWKRRKNANMSEIKIPANQVIWAKDNLLRAIEKETQMMENGVDADIDDVAAVAADGDEEDVEEQSEDESQEDT